jgi:hypothetical protein
VIRALAAASAAVLATVAFAGCGSDTVSTADYAKSVSLARDRVDFALARITAGEGSVEELLRRMEQAADDIDAAANDLNDAGSADGFDDETDTLVAAYHQLAAGLAATAHDARQPGMEGLVTGSNALRFPGWTKANRVLASLKQQGVAVEPIGSH